MIEEGYGRKADDFRELSCAGEIIRVRCLFTTF
jgi:hypothetical protein